MNFIKPTSQWLRNQPPRALLNVGLMTVLLLVVVVGGLNQRAVSSASPNANRLSSAQQSSARIDTVSTVYIAANVATQLELPVASRVNEQVAKINTANYNAVDNDGLVSKPSVVDTPGETIHEIETYLVKEGDKLKDIAKEYGISQDTIIWANDINSSDDLVPNMELRILPVDGVLHTVADGDSINSIANYYGAKASEVINFNDLEVDGIKNGMQIVIPDGTKPEPVPAPISIAPATFSQSFIPAYGAGNGYDWGWCTWHAANRRAQIGRPIPTNWGNAISWRYNAAASGYTIGSVAKAGSVAYYRNIGGWGHVGFVERVTDDGAWFSDMNYPIWGQATHRFVPASEFSNYNFIY